MDLLQGLFVKKQCSPYSDTIGWKMIVFPVTFSEYHVVQCHFIRHDSTCLFSRLCLKSCVAVESRPMIALCCH